MSTPPVGVNARLVAKRLELRGDVLLRWPAICGTSGQTLRQRCHGRPNRPAPCHQPVPGSPDAFAARRRARPLNGPPARQDDIATSVTAARRRNFLPHGPPYEQPGHAATISAHSPSANWSSSDSAPNFQPHSTNGESHRRPRLFSLPGARIPTSIGTSPVWSPPCGAVLPPTSASRSSAHHSPSRSAESWRYPRCPGRSAPRRSSAWCHRCHAVLTGEHDLTILSGCTEVTAALAARLDTAPEIPSRRPDGIWRNYSR